MLRFNIPIVKVDEERREVWGCATAEEIDKQGEVVAFEGSKKAFAAWADQFEKATGGMSLGNIREMHQPIAAGKMIAWAPEEKARAIYIGAKVVDDDAWVKTRERVYTGFSIGGNPTKTRRMRRDGKVVKVIEEYDLVEVSLVDNPASPSSIFTVVKANGTGNAPQPGAEPAPQGAESEKSGKHPGGKQRFDSCVRQVEAEGDVDSPYAVCTAALQGKNLDSMTDEEFQKAVDEAVRSYRGKKAAAKKAAAVALRKMVHSESMSIMPAIRALEAICVAMDSEIAEGYMAGGLDEEQRGDVAELVATAEGILGFIYGELQQQLRALTAQEGPVSGEVKAMLERLEVLRKNLTPAQLRKVMDDKEMQENLAAMHEMGHGLTRATYLMGAKCKAGTCMGEETEEKPPAEDEGAESEKQTGTEKEKAHVGEMGKPTEAEPEGGTPGKKPTTAEPDLGNKPGGKPTVAEPDSKSGADVGSHAPGRKSLDPAMTKYVEGLEAALKSVAEVGEVLKGIKATMDSHDARLKKVESQPASVGRPVTAPDKTLGGTGATAAGGSTTVAEVLQKMAEETNDPAVKEKLIMKSVELQVKTLNAGAGA